MTNLRDSTTKFRDDWKRGRAAELARVPERPPIPATPRTDEVGGGWYLAAFALPPVGLILGILAASRNQVGPALALWATSLFVGPVAWLVFWNVLLAAVLASA